MAYAAVLSLMHVLEQTIQQKYNFLNRPVKKQIASLLKKVISLQDFLENYSQNSSETIESLENQIRDAAHLAEDIVESYIVYRLPESASNRGNILLMFCSDLEKVNKEIMKQAMKIKDNIVIEDQQPRIWMPSKTGKTFVGLENDLVDIKTLLVRKSSRLETVSIVGMGGMGKTTLAQKVYDDAFILYHFHIRAWVTVSQDYNVQEVLLSLLDSITNHTYKMHEKETEELKDLLYRGLKGKRYLIVMDDVWDDRIWDELQRLFPDDKNSSRIMLTTRLEQVGLHYPNSCSHQMRYLNEDESCTLFCENVFGEKFFPPEFENVGKNICRNCRGLPISIVVIAGILSKATKTHDEWKKIAENISSVVTSNDEQCSKILYLSYKNLPHHLKGCYLYMGIFPEDFNIRVSVLFKLWIAEGLVKSTGSKTLEDAAEEYLLDLVQRSLVMVHEESTRGKIKTCKIHDLLRNLCTNEARRRTFFHVSSHGTPLDIKRLRRTVIHQGKTIGSGHRVSIHPDKNYLHRVKRPCTPLSRSIIHFDLDLDTKKIYFRLLKVLYIHHDTSDLPKEIIELVNLRYINARGYLPYYLASIDKLQYLQTIILSCSIHVSFQLPQQIWKMQQLRHVQLKWNTTLPCPPKERIKGEISVIVLENLQTLSVIVNFRCTEAVVKRIPNLKKLEVYYDGPSLDWEYYRLNNLARLHKLESLQCNFARPSPSFLQNLTFPTSLITLTLSGCCLPWKDMTIVGSLPNLQVLKLERRSFEGPEWEPIEGEFLKLKYLLLQQMNLKHWRAENVHFPILEQLVIERCKDLEEFPFDIEEIPPTLDSIELHYCRLSVVTSAEKIQEEELSIGNQLRLKVFAGTDPWGPWGEL